MSFGRSIAFSETSAGNTDHSARHAACIGCSSARLAPRKVAARGSRAAPCRSHVRGRLRSSPRSEPVTGRFTSPDPYIDFGQGSQGLNPYSYVSNRPLRFTDPSGYTADGTDEESIPQIDITGCRYDSILCGGWFFDSFFPRWDPGRYWDDWLWQQFFVAHETALPNATRGEVNAFLDTRQQEQSSWASFKEWWSTSRDWSYCGRTCAVNGDMPSHYQLSNGDIVMNAVNTATIVATALSGGTSLTATAVPRGFANAAQFERACAELCSALTESGLSNFSIGVRGSSITGRSFATGAPFNAASDIDFFLASSAMRGFPINSYGLVYPSVLGRAFPALGEWSAAWSNTLGRSVTVGGFATVPEGSVLLVVP
jgi:hypothetical protein